MISTAPAFWWTSPGWQAAALSPLAAIYGAVAGRRLRDAARERVAIPVLCVGNFTVGGSGKTPVAIALAKTARDAGRKPGFLTRGHGGSLTAPHLVDPAADDSRRVGDEPLLLADHAPVAVTADRAAGARLLIEAGCDFAIMDDGFQSARVDIDYALIVVDSHYGIGNGSVVPAGPVRAPLADQMRYADGLVCIGDGVSADPLVEVASMAGKTVFRASATVRNPGSFVRRRFLAFAGIGHPDKFFDAVAAAGGEVVVAKRFADHHRYVARDLETLVARAAAERLALVTTSKDFARLRGMVAGVASAAIEVLDMDIRFEPETSARSIVALTLETYRTRSAGQ